MVKEGQRAVENMINGNLTDAKRLAKGASKDSLINRAKEMGYRNPAAVCAYLKGKISFNTCCRMNDPPEKPDRPCKFCGADLDKHQGKYIGYCDVCEKYYDRFPEERR